MDHPRVNALSSKIFFFSRLILSFLLICLMLVLNFLDFKEIRRHTEYLSLLKKASEFDRETELDQALGSSVQTWLLEEHPGVAQKNGATRVTIAKFLLNNQSSSLEMLGSIKGNDGSENDFQTMTIKHSDTLMRYVGRQEENVSGAIAMFKGLAKPLDVRILTGIDTSSLSAESLNFKKLRIVGDSVRLFFAEESFAQRNSTGIQTLSLKGEFEEIRTLSPLVFGGLDSVMVREMLQNPDQLTRIEGLYGIQSTDEMQNLITDLLEKNLEPVAILGFDVSRKWFPLALLSVLFMVNFLILSHLITAYRQSLPVISGATSQDNLEFLVANPSNSLYPLGFERPYHWLVRVLFFVDFLFTGILSLYVLLGTGIGIAGVNWVCDIEEIVEKTERLFWHN